MSTQEEMKTNGLISQLVQRITAIEEFIRNHQIVQHSTGGLTVGNVGTTPNSGGATIADQVLTLQPASATLPGVVSTASQSFLGSKTFLSTSQIVGEFSGSGADSRLRVTNSAPVSTSNVSILEYVLNSSVQARSAVILRSSFSVTADATRTAKFEILAMNSGSFAVPLTIVGDKASLAAPINLKNYTVATLPAGVRGDIAYVTDALGPTFLAAVIGGGAVVTPVFYNGANWVAF